MTTKFIVFKGLFGRSAWSQGLVAVGMMIGGAVSALATLQPETQAYLDRCTTTLDPDFIDAADRFIVRGKTAGWWDNLIDIHFFCAPTQQAALLNVKSGTLMNLTVSGSVQHTPYSGIKGDGSTGYLDTGKTPSALSSSGFTLGSNSMFVFCNSDSSSLAGDVGASNGGYTIGIRARNGATQTIWSMNNTSVVFNGMTTAKGLNGFVRTGTDGGFRVRNGTATDFTNAALGLPTTNIRYLRQGGSSYYSANELAFGFVGNGSITKVQAEDLYLSCIEMLGSLGGWSEMEPELASYITRASNTTFDLDFVLAANRFITRAKTNGWWSKLKAVHFFCAPSEEAALQNVKEDNYNLTKSGGTIFTPRQGIKGNGVDAQLDYGIAVAGFSGLTINGHSMFVFCQSDNPSLASDMGSLGGGNNCGIRCRNAVLASLWSSNITQIQRSVASARGLTGFVRSGSTAVHTIKYHVAERDADGWVDQTQTASALPTGTVRYLRHGTSQYFSKNELAFGFVGDGTINETQAKDIYEACMEMLGEDGLKTLQQDEDLEPAEPPHAFGPDCVNAYPATKVTPTGLQIFRMAAPPVYQDMNYEGVSPYDTPQKRGYAYGPITDCITRPWGTGATSQDDDIGRWELIWSDRALGGWAEKPNDTMGGMFYGEELLNDSFGDGERATQSLPASAKWLGNTVSALAVTGSALTVAPGGNAIAYFTSTAEPRVLDDQDYIVARFSLVLSGSNFPTTSDFFRVALLNSHGTSTDHNAVATASRVSADVYGPSTSAFFSNGGYMFTAPISGAANTLKDHAHKFSGTAGLLETASYDQVSVTGGSGTTPGFSPGVKYVGTLKIQRSGTSTIQTLTFVSEQADNSWTFSRTDTSAGGACTFDALAFGLGSGGGFASAKLDDVAVVFYSNANKPSVRTEFTTYQKAIGSTLVKTAYSAGLQFRDDPDHPDGKGWGDIAEDWGYDVSVWDAYWAIDHNHPIFSRNLNVDTGDIAHFAYYADPGHTQTEFSYVPTGGVFRTSRDQVILGQGRLADIPMKRGFVIDHEHADDRSPALELQFIQEMSKIAHCKDLQLGASGHPAYNATGEHSGWTAANAAQILDLLDWYNVLADGSISEEELETELNAQFDFFKDGSGNVANEKLCLQLAVGGPDQEMSLAKAQIARDFMIEKEIPRCVIVPLYATFGGALSRQPNQVVAKFLNLPLE